MTVTSAADDEQERATRPLLPTRAGVCAPGSRPACDRAVVRRGHSFLPASRAITHVVGKAIGSSRRRTPAARPEQARAGPGLGGARIWAKASAGTRRRLLAGSMDAGRTSSLLLAICRSRMSFGRETCVDLVAVLGLDCPDTSHIVSMRAGVECPPGDRYVTFEVASYCGLIPAASMIRAALSLSRSTNRVKSGCVMLIGSPPCFTSEARTPGSDRARAMSSASV